MELNEAEKRNIDSNRLIFAKRIPFYSHLARQSLGDLGLDTFNFNGHKTTLDALYAGLPILTKSGKNFVMLIHVQYLVIEFFLKTQAELSL